MNLKSVLRRTPSLVTFYRLLKVRDYPLNRDNKAFHGDRILQNLICEIISCLPVTSFVETGTYYGDSTAYVAGRWRKIKVFTSEINNSFVLISRFRLRNFNNVEIFMLSSEKFVRGLLNQRRLGNLPLFFLDAHGYSYWPLEDEMDAICSSGLPAIIIIDDFKVPRRSEFGFDARDQRVCALDLIKPKMTRKNLYNVLFPHYTKEDAFPNGNVDPLRGYIVLFQNLKENFEKFKQRSFVSQNYEEINL